MNNGVPETKAELVASLKALGYPDDEAEKAASLRVKSDDKLRQAESERQANARREAIATSFGPIQKAVVHMLEEKGPHAIGLKALADAGVKGFSASWGLDANGVWCAAAKADESKAKTSTSNGTRTYTKDLYGVTPEEAYAKHANDAEREAMGKAQAKDLDAGNNSASWRVKHDVVKRLVKEGVLKA
mgnify:CR=1 FL=1